MLIRAVTDAPALAQQQLQSQLRKRPVSPMRRRCRRSLRRSSICCWRSYRDELGAKAPLPPLTIAHGRGQENQGRDAGLCIRER